MNLGQLGTLKEGARADGVQIAIHYAGISYQLGWFKNQAEKYLRIPHTSKVNHSTFICKQFQGRITWNLKEQSNQMYIFIFH